MSKLALSVLSLAALPTAAEALVALQPPQEARLKERDHKKLGEGFADCITAMRDKKDVDETRQDLEEELGKIAKKLKIESALELTEDLEQAFWHSFRYDKAKGIKKGKVSDFKAELPSYGEKGGVEYALWAPSKYAARSGPYPLILCIPDKGETPETHLVERWADGDLRDYAIIACCEMPEDEDLWTQSFVQGKTTGFGNVLVMFKDVYERYAVDFDRVYLAGRGLGVKAAVAVGAMVPDRLAGVIGRSGDAGDVAYDNYANIDTWFSGGAAGVTAFEEAVKERGFENCTVDPDGTEKDLLAWLESRSRNSNPAEVVLVPGEVAPLRSFWLEVPRSAYESARIHGKIDRETNTITIEGTGAREVTLHLNDLLVDLSRPVKVVCNGAEHLELIPRNLGTTLNAMFRSLSDPGKLYTATRVFDLPAPKD